MANNVYNDISLVSSNKSARKKFIEAFQSIEDLSECGLEFSSILPEWDGEWASREYMEENVGPKWANLESYEGEDYAYVVSAWGPPIAFMRQLARELSSLDADVKLRMNYTDEFYNFIGTWVYANGEEDYEEADGDWFFRKRAEEIGTPLKEYDTFEDDGWYDFIDETISHWADDMLRDNDEIELL